MKRTMKKLIPILILSLGAVSCAPVSSNSSPVGKSTQIQQGMTKAQVTAIMGRPDEIDTYSKSEYWTYKRGQGSKMAEQTVRGLVTVASIGIIPASIKSYSDFRVKFGEKGTVTGWDN